MPAGVRSHPGRTGARIRPAAGPLLDRIRICPVTGVSTQEEAKSISKCLPPSGIKNPISNIRLSLPTALAVLRRELPQYHWSIATVTDHSVFGAEPWWQRREWAKTTVLEWSKFAWWEAVDRWRNRRGIDENFRRAGDQSPGASSLGLAYIWVVELGLGSFRAPPAETQAA